MKAAYGRLILGLCSVSLLACQQGVKKDGDTSVYDSGIARCETLAANLKDHGIDLSGNGGAESDADITLADESKSDEAMKEEKPQLEEYITVAEKLLQLGDEQVVVFPKKAEISTGHDRAVSYLGQIFAERKVITGNDSNSFTSPEVDHAEYNARFKRFSTVFLSLEKAGFKMENLGDVNAYKTAAKGLNTEALKPLVDPPKSAAIDAARVRALSVRNNHWQEDGMQTVEDSTKDFIAYFWSVEDAVTGELKNRGWTPTDGTK